MKKIDRSLLAKQILLYRKKNGLSQAALAEACGIHRSMLSHIENETYDPSLTQLETLCAVCRLDPCALFVEKEKETEEKIAPQRIVVAGTGYVGLSVATLLSQHHHVLACDILAAKVEAINRRDVPLRDDVIEAFFQDDKAGRKTTASGCTSIRRPSRPLPAGIVLRGMTRRPGTSSTPTGAC